MGIKERLVTFLEHLKIGQKKFEVAAGLSNGFVNNIGNGISTISTNKIRSAYPELNIDWLLTGEGDMFNTVSIVKEPHEPYGKVNNGIPVYDIDATAGGGLDFSNQLPETIKGYINLPNFKNCIAFIMVKGDSMYPRFKAGDLIGLEPLLDMDIIQWGQTYVVLTKDNQRLLKYVRKGKDEKHLILRSENPKYDDMDLHKSKVQKLFMAKGPVRDDWQ